jgi:hypothetical protein
MASTFQGLSFYDVAGTSLVDGIFLPIATLPGLIATEIADAQLDHLKYSKTLNAISETLFSAISNSSFAASVSFSANKLAPAGAGLEQITQGFSFSFSKVLDLQGQEILEVPVPTVGSNIGIGDIDLTDVFPSASKVTIGGAISGAGVVVSTSLLTPYSSITHAGLTINGSMDNREALSALIMFLGNASLLRSTTQASGITSRTVQTTPTISAIPASFTALPNPTSGIDPTQVLVRSLITRTCTITFNYSLNVSAQTFDVRSVTA